MNAKESKQIPDVDSCIKERRSIRSYLSKKISDEQIKEIIDAARYAPAAGNLQNLYFIIVKSKKKRQEIAKACLDQLWMLEAPIFIVVCSKPTRIKMFYGERGDIYSLQGCGAAIQNMLLKAHSLGLATCWVGAFDPVKMKSILLLPEDITPEAIVTLGYGNETPKMPPKPKLERIIFFEEWGNK